MRRLLVSTDIGSDIDDAMALLVLLNQEAPLEAVYTVNGDVEARSLIAKELVELAGKHVTVARGEGAPLGDTPPYSFFERCHVPERFFDPAASHSDPPALLPLDRAGIEIHGTQDLGERLTRERFVVLSLGPLTTLAEALRRRPEAGAGIEHLYVMGGRLSGDLEHNFRHDPPAARRVLESDVPVTLVPGDVCDRMQLPVAELACLTSPAGEYVRRMADTFIAIKTASAMNEQLPDGRDFPGALKEALMRVNGLHALDLQERLALHEDRIYWTEKWNNTRNAVRNPGEYAGALLRLLKHLRDPRLFSKARIDLAELIESRGPKEISIADIYVPYSLAHPEKLVLERGTVECLPDGRSKILPGDRHAIVRDIDYSHFQEFLRRFLF